MNVTPEKVDELIAELRMNRLAQRSGRYDAASSDRDHAMADFEPVLLRRIGNKAESRRWTPIAPTAAIAP